jgi:hypothetical protein
MGTRAKKPVELHDEDLAWVEQSKLIAKADYVEIEAGVITAVYCKKCGTKIQGLVPDGRAPKLMKGPKGMIEQWFVRISALPTYTSVIITCDDGSKHESPCCTRCAPLLTEDDLDAFLIIDTEAEIKVEGKAGRQIRENTLRQRVMRRTKRKET